jgi:metal-dependent amidase/aminoacylase/carboxypeptidase family protein
MERQYMVEGCRIHSIVTDVVGAHNIIPSKAVLRVNVRAMTDDVLAKLCERVIDIANGAAMTTRTTVDIQLVQTAKPYQMHGGLAHLAWEAMDLPDGTYFDVGGSTDLGDVSVALPTVTVTETGWEPTTWHSRDLHDAAGTDGAYASMHRAADAMVGVCARILAGAAWR